MMLPDTIEARTVRIQHGAATPDDLAWIRGVEQDGRIVCDCRCRCHGRKDGTGSLTATGAMPGSCGLLLSLAFLDCERGCRSAHILASECQLDETRVKVGAHV